MKKMIIDDTRNGLDPHEDELESEAPTTLEIILSFLIGIFVR